MNHERDASVNKMLVQIDRERKRKNIVICV